MRKHYPFIFSLNAVPALLRYPKLFARYSLRTILTATPTHTPCFRHRRRSCSLPSSKRGTPPFKYILLVSYSLPAKPLVTGIWRLVTTIAVADPILLIILFNNLNHQPNTASKKPAATAEPITPATLGPIACIRRKFVGLYFLPSF